MRIIAANNFYYLRGGSEYVYFLESRLLESHGHTVAPFSMQHPLNMASEYSSFFPGYFDPLAPGALKKIPAAFRLIYSLETRNRFNELMDIVNPDIVHGHNIYGRLTTSIIDASVGRGVPFVMTLHDYKLICASYLLLNKGNPCTRCVTGSSFGCIITRCHKNSLAASTVSTAETLFNRITGKYLKASLFISPSRFLIERHIEVGFPADKFIHIPNAIDIGNYQPEFKPGDYVLFVGRLSHEKGILTLLEAFKGLSLRLRIAGEGPLKAQCEAYALANDMSNVSFEGYQSGDALSKLFSGAMFTVMPSGWYENAPISLIESFAYGKPVIGSAIGGIPEMIDDNHDGLLCKPFDSADLREKILHLSSNPGVIESMGRRARMKAESRHNPETHYQSLIAAYENALK